MHSFIAQKKYAHAFDAPFQPHYLENIDLWMLKRAIPNTPYFDLIGCYPICIFANLDGMEKDVAALKDEGIVSLVLVTDVCTQPSQATLQQHFDLLSPL